MIDCHMASAFCAITAITDVATLESAQELGAFDEAHLFFLPQCECTHRRSGITPAILAVAIAHVQRIAAHLDLHRSAVTSASVRFGHNAVSRVIQPRQWRHPRCRLPRRRLDSSRSSSDRRTRHPRCPVGYCGPDAVTLLPGPDRAARAC
jgi:hypothetical protein